MRKVDNGEKRGGPGGAGGTRSPSAMPHHLEHPIACKIQNGHPRALKMEDGVWKEVQPKFIGPFDKLLLIKFFDSIISFYKNIKNDNGHQ